MISVLKPVDIIHKKITKDDPYLQEKTNTSVAIVDTCTEDTSYPEKEAEPNTSTVRAVISTRKEENSYLENEASS